MTVTLQALESLGSNPKSTTEQLCTLGKLTSLILGFLMFLYNRDAIICLPCRITVIDVDGH